MELAINPALVDWRGADGRAYRAAYDRAGVLIFRPRLAGWRERVHLASGKTVYYITKVLNWFYNATAFTPPATLYFALWTTTLTSASTGSSGTEASYTSYARVAVTANTTNFPLSSAGSNIQNATAITWPANTGSLNTCTFVAICDAATTGNMLYFGSITSTAVNPGDTPQININGLTASEA